MEIQFLLGHGQPCIGSLEAVADKPQHSRRHVCQIPFGLEVFNHSPPLVGALEQAIIHDCQQYLQGIGDDHLLLVRPIACVWQRARGIVAQSDVQKRVAHGDGFLRRFVGECCNELVRLQGVLSVQRLREAGQQTPHHVHALRVHVAATRVAQVPLRHGKASAPQQPRVQLLVPQNTVRQCSAAGGGVEGETRAAGQGGEDADQLGAPCLAVAGGHRERRPAGVLHFGLPEKTIRKLLVGLLVGGQHHSGRQLRLEGHREDPGQDAEDVVDGRVLVDDGVQGHQLQALHQLQDEVGHADRLLPTQRAALGDRDGLAHLLEGHRRVAGQDHDAPERLLILADRDLDQLLDCDAQQRGRLAIIGHGLHKTERGLACKRGAGPNHQSSGGGRRGRSGIQALDLGKLEQPDLCGIEHLGLHVGDKDAVPRPPCDQVADFVKRIVLLRLEGITVRHIVDAHTVQELQELLFGVGFIGINEFIQFRCQ
mmetsp:Transcript_83193/g.138776  ORF Transcript_83193/g.138776 Transcript_83193/m.138776 type:complete len:482 (+) Transcript_83193:3010-4455(+)